MDPYLVGLLVPVLLTTIGSCDVSAHYIQIPPGEGLQNYLCKGSLLQSNTTILLTPGEHRISSGPICSIFNVSNVSITGSSSEDTIVRCQGDGVLGFVFANNVTIERIAFVGCGQTENLAIKDHLSVTLLFQFSLNISIRHCRFENNNALYAVRIQSSGVVDIASCVFQNNTGPKEDGGAILLEDSTSITITDCTFRGSRFSRYVINGLYSDSVSVSACTFHDVVASEGVIALHAVDNSTHITGCAFEAVKSATVIYVSSNTNGRVFISGCTFRDISATLLVIYVLECDSVCISNCSFQNSTDSIGVAKSNNVTIADSRFQGINRSLSSGGIVIQFVKIWISERISNCTFDANNSTTVVYISQSRGSTHITDCTFQDNVVDTGLVFISDATLSAIFITNCTLQNNFVGGQGTAMEITDALKSNGIIEIKGCAFQNNIVKGNGVIYLFLDEESIDVVVTNCTFQDLNVSAPALVYGISSGNISITDCRFENITFRSYMIGVYHYGQADAYIYVGSCIFQNMKGYYKVILMSLGRAFVSIENSAFVDINIGDDVGSILNLIQLQPSGNTPQYITNCTFQNIRNTGLLSTAIRLQNINGSIFITGCKFKDNILGVGGVQSLDHFHMSITSCTFQNNTSQYSSIILLRNSHIQNCTFRDNRGAEGGAILALMPETYTVKINDCTFYNNSAQFGGAISISSKGTVLINNSRFIRNNAIVGAAIHARNDRPVYTPISVIQLSRLTLVDVIIKENYCSCDGYNDTRGGAMYFSGINVDIGGSTDRGSLIISNSPQGAIQGLDIFLQLWGMVTFSNNTGENGGAISLQNNVQLFFLENCTVEFIGNRAARFGGAIYIEREQKRIATKADLDIGFEIFSYCVMTIHGNHTITFKDNHAVLSGHAIYATPLYHCHNPVPQAGLLDYLLSNFSTFQVSEFVQEGTLSLYQQLFKIIPSLGDSNTAQIVSFPTNVQIFGIVDQADIYHSGEQSAQTYPGGTIWMNISSVDYANVFTPSAVYAQITADTSSTILQRIRLGDQQNVQWIGGEYSTVEYQIYGPENTSLNLLLSSYPGNAPTIIQVTLLPCLIGFTLVSDKCICSEFFTSLGMVCDTAHGTVTREGTNWMGVYHDENKPVPALASTCPLNYCKITHTVSLIEPGDLCNGGRTGTLCGSCSDGQSVVFGSSQCQVCSDEWLITILMYAVLGASLVAVLFILNITVTQGTLYGLVFYANIVQVNASIFFNQSALRPLQVMISLINLDLGLPQCFYHGMDDIAKTGLQFVFPTYLLTLTIIITVVCHYCLRHSTQNNHWFDKPSYIVGQRAVGVLSTLIYLSYSKVLRTVIDIFTFSTIHFPQGSELVWFYDGNIKYLHGRHIVLFVIAMVICIAFLLPYTLALTFIPFIERYNEQNRLFNYLYKQTNRIKPMNDAYYAPYKGEWRFWLGARLWFLVFIYSLNPVYSSDQPSLLLLIHAIVVTVFMLVQSEVKPFGESIQATDRHCRKVCISNRFWNMLDTFYLLNYITLAQSVSYILYHDSHPTQKNTLDIAVGVLVGMYGVVLMTTISYHFIVTILKVCNKYDTIKEKVNNLMFPTQIQYQPIELEEPADDDDDGDYSNLREPLSERL